MATTTTTTATVTVGGGTTVDNLNVLDAIKTNDTNGVEYIYWSDISTFLRPCLRHNQPLSLARTQPCRSHIT